MKFDSNEYWENRYKTKGTSGSGSYGILCEYKAEIINSFIEYNNINTLGDFGCGDGNQLKHFNVKNYYGYDISKTIIEQNKLLFSNDNSKKFDLISNYDNNIKFDLVLSLDIIFHLVDDNIFEEYMKLLFNASNKYVIIYSSNGDKLKISSKHVFDRNFTKWVAYNVDDFKLITLIKNKYTYDPSDPINTSISDFYFYEKIVK